MLKRKCLQSNSLSFSVLQFEQIPKDIVQFSPPSSRHANFYVIIFILPSNVVRDQRACCPVLSCAVSAVSASSDHSESAVSRRFRNRPALPHFPNPRHSRRVGVAWSDLDA